jgi:glycosyltransferase involved in cell wall biosynthesis
MNIKPGISIAMATYNGEKYIREQLESFSTQTLLPFELVVTDDGSRDRTLDIVEEFARESHFPVKVIKNDKRLGYGENFLKAASLCSAEYIAFSTQDDIWLPHKLATCSEALDDPDVLLCIHSAITWSKETGLGYRHPDFKTTIKFGLETNHPQKANSGFAVVFKRFILDYFDSSKRPRTLLSLGGEPVMMGHDEWVWFLACSLGSVVQISDALALYRQHGSNTHGAPERKSLRRILELSKSQTAYREMSVQERECARLLSEYLEIPDPDHAAALRRTISRFDKIADLHDLRGMIYDNKSTLLIRIGCFLKMMRMGGYRDANGMSALGRQAALKDSLFGVSGIFKLNL